MQWIGITQTSTYPLHHGRHTIRIASLTIKVLTQVSQEMMKNRIIEDEFSGKILVFLDANVRSVFVSFQKYWITQFLMFQQILVWSPILITNLSEMVLVHTNRARFHLILSCRAHTKPITLLIIMWPQPVWVSVHWMGHSRTKKSRTIRKWRYIHGWDECMRRKIKEVHINLVPYHL